MLGRRSATPRQLDVAIYRADDEMPYFIADAKWHDRPLDVSDVDGFVGLMDDVGAAIGLLAAPKGFSRAARRRAAASDVSLIVMSLDQARRFRWMPTAWEMYRWDSSHRHDVAKAIQALVDVELPWSVGDALESVAFEEWDAFFRYMMVRQAESTSRILEFIATTHHDDGWVFNSARILLEHGALRGDVRAHLVRAGDPDLLELLAEEDPETTERP